MAEAVFTGGVGMMVRPDGESDQILAVDLTVRPQGPHRTVVLPLSIPAEKVSRIDWLTSSDHALFTRLDALFHPLVRDATDAYAPAANAPAPRIPPKATVEGGIVVGRDGLMQAGLTGRTGEIAADTVCLWARITPPALPVLVRWLGFRWGWPKAVMVIRMPRPDVRRVVFPTRGLAHWPQAFNPGPTLYVQSPRKPGPIWVDPEQAPGHPFDWRHQERAGPRPSPLDEHWPLFRAYSTDRAAGADIEVELLDRGARPSDQGD